MPSILLFFLNSSLTTFNSRKTKCVPHSPGLAVSPTLAFQADIQIICNTNERRKDIEHRQLPLTT